jgi:outer membrane protein TolC
MIFRGFTSLCIGGLAIASFAAPAHAQRPGRPKGDKTDKSDRTDKPEKAEKPVEKSGRRSLSLADAIAIALEYNGDLYLAKTDTAIASDEIAIADSIFIPSLISEVSVGSDRNPASPTAPDYTAKSANGSIGITGRRPIGLDYTITLGTTYESIKANNSVEPVSYYDPGYTTTFGISLVQPLLRGAGSRANRAAIVVATHRKNVSEHQLRATVQRVVGEVVVAYWTLALAYKEIEARQSQLKLAEDQVAESTRLVKLGSLSDLDITEARAAVARQTQQLLRVEQAALDSEAKLRTLLVGGDGAWAPDQRLVPSDTADVGEAPGTLDQHVEIARKNRPDIAVARSQVDADRALLAQTENELRPVLDLFATGGVIGFAGDPVAGIDPTAYNPDFTGGGGRAFGNLAKRGDYQVEVGLRLELPLSNEAARARNARQRNLVKRSKIAEETIGAQIRNDVQTAIALMTSDLAQRAAADDAVADNEKLLAGMRKRFAGGLITSFDVLRVADQLTLARIEAARTRASYQVSRARLAAADGTLLQSLNIKLSNLKDR